MVDKRSETKKKALPLISRVTLYLDVKSVEHLKRISELDIIEEYLYDNARITVKNPTRKEERCGTKVIRNRIIK